MYNSYITNSIAYGERRFIVAFTRAFIIPIFRFNRILKALLPSSILSVGPAHLNLGGLIALAIKMPSLPILFRSRLLFYPLNCKVIILQLESSKPAKLSF